jgi:hypothetical protein
MPDRATTIPSIRRFPAGPPPVALGGPVGLSGLVGLVLTIAAVAGCRTALQGGPAPSAAEPPRIAPRTIPLEFVFVRHDEHDAVIGAELWGLVDEQALDAGARERLQANGLRAGVVTARLPPHIAVRFTPEPPAAGETLPTALPENPALVRHSLRLLPGRSSDVLATAGIDELVLLQHDDGTVRGGTYRDASTVVAIRAYPAPDGRVRLRLVPTVKHGPMERSWVGEEGMFRLEAGQRREKLESLAIDTELPPGTMLVLGCSGERASTVGDAFFRDPRGSGRRLLAVMPTPAVPPVDPMFAPAAAAAADEPPSEP